MTVSTPTVGQVLGHYRILEQIGAGGMGVVFRARDERLDRDVALKTLPRLALVSEAALRQFRREALSLGKITDPHVAMAFDFARDDGIDYLVTEYVPGLTLDAKLAGRPLPEAEVFQLGKQLASGLAAAHDQGVIHRDLKPGNLRVTPDGRLKILDFGLAKFFHPEAGPEATLSAADTTNISGTIPYMSPEQLRGDALDARTDIYAAGAVLYELATGRRPFPERQLARLIDDILNNDPPPASRINRAVSSELESVLRKALAHRPEDRYQSARELHADLELLSTSQLPRAAVAKPRFNRVAAGVALLAILVA